MDNEKLCKDVAEKFLGWKPHNDPEIEWRTHSCTHIAPEGGYYGIPDFFDESWNKILRDELAERACIVQYVTMKDGKWGHFVTLRYLENRWMSFHAGLIEMKGDSFEHALVLACAKLAEVQPYENMAPL